MTTIGGRSTSVAIDSGSSAVLKAAGVAALSSGVLRVFMVAFLLAMFAAFAIGATLTALALGWISGVLVIPVYGLALPVVVALRRTGRGRGLLLAALGAGGMFATIALQWLLVSGAMTFREQVRMVSVALLAVGT